MATIHNLRVYKVAKEVVNTYPLIILCLEQVELTLQTLPKYKPVMEVMLTARNNRLKMKQIYASASKIINSKGLV